MYRVYRIEKTNRKMSDTCAAPEVLDITPTAYEQLAKHIDIDELKRTTIKQVMASTAGKNPLDYYLAEMAVDVWLRNHDKTAEELEAYIREADPLALGPEYEGGFSVVGDKLEPTPEIREDELAEPIPCSA